MVQTVAYAFCAVPLQDIEKITDRVVAVFVGDHRNCVCDFLLNSQPIIFFKVQKQVFDIYISQCRAFTIPAEGLHNVDSFGQEIFPDCSFQVRVTLQNTLIISGCVVDLAFLALL